MARTPVSTIAQYAPLTIYVRGQVTFSRIASQVTGAELAKQNQEAAAKGRMPHSKPYTAISIKNPTIMDNGKLPPQVKQVIQERFYTKQDGTVMFSQESKSPFLPTVVYSTEAGELAGQGIADKNVPLQAELAVGLDITIGVSLFNKNGFAGLGMNYILVNEPIRYYSNSAIAADFAAQGITYKAPSAVNNSAEPTSTISYQQSTPAVNYQQTAPEVTPPWEDSGMPFANAVPPEPTYQAPAYQPTAAPMYTQPTTDRPKRYY